jgi:hypothetical protein
MSPAAPLRLAAMMTAIEMEWRANAPEDWTTIDFRDWPRGFHRSGWVVAGHIGWNPLDVLDQPPPAARAVNALLTRLCVTVTLAIIKHVADPNDPDEPLLAWFNAAVHEFEDDIARMIETVGDIEWRLPTSRRWAGRRLVRIWERGGVRRPAARDRRVDYPGAPALNDRDGGAKCVAAGRQRER